MQLNPRLLVNLLVKPTSNEPYVFGKTIGKTTGNSSQTLLAFYRIFGLSWENILVIVEVVFTVDYLFTCMFFFSGDVLWRNHLINRVVLFEEKSILVFPECLEASEW